MSTNATSAADDAERLVRYIIHHRPGNDVLPKFKKEMRRCKIKSFRKRDPPARPLYTILSVGNVSHRCDLGIEQSWEFVAPYISTLQIDLYIEEKERIRIATTRRELASLVDASYHSPQRVPLDVCSTNVVNGPSVELMVALEPLTAHDATETTPAPGESSIPETPHSTIIDESPSRVSTPELLCENVGTELTEMRAHLSIPEKWGILGRYTRTVVEIGGAVAEINPIAQAVFALLDLGTKEVSKRKNYHDDIHSLIDQATKVCEIIIRSDKRGFEAKRPEQLEAVKALVAEIYQVLAFVQSLTSMNIVQRSRTAINERVREMLQRLQQLEQHVESGGLLDLQNAMFRVEEVVTRLDIENTLYHLPIAKDCQAGSSKGCLPNTRVRLLAEIVDWAFDPKGQRCLILRGAAGKGKSAVANSVARILADMGAIAPFFAFDRTNPSRHAHHFYPTLAEYLARYNQSYLDVLRRLSSTDLRTTDIQDQHRLLMLPALRHCSKRVPVVFVVDALDECPASGEGNAHIHDRAYLLATLRACISDDQISDNIRFFFTARPDPDIIASLSENGTCTVLHSIDDITGTEDDIHKFVVSKLVKDPAYVDLVTEAAQSHFECAALLCRELTGQGKPMSSSRRQELLQRVKLQPGRSLYGTYQLVLETHLDMSDAGCLSVYRQLLSWVLAVRQPQSRAVFEEISALLLPDEDVMGVLEGLGSLLTGTIAGAEEPVRPLHTSFHDFVLDAEASGPFAITSEFDAADSQLVHACFRIMGRPESGLHYNICNLYYPFVYKIDVENLGDCLTVYLSPGLRYACREVSAHLSRCHDRDEVAGLAYALRGFLHKHFLFWLEACGWLGHEPCDSLRDMLHWAKKDSKDSLTLILMDFVAFEKRFHKAISMSPPQVYITGLLFAPINSLVSRLYRPRVASPIDISGYEREREWPPNETLVIQVVYLVPALAFSPDGSKIVAGLFDQTIRIWDAETGRQLGSAMRGHDDVVFSVAFSPDGTMIASGSQDHTVRLWDAKTGQQQGKPLRGHPYAVQSVAFSPDSATVVSGSDDRTLQFWDSKTGKEMGGALKEHRGGVNSVVFSHDGTLIVSGADDRTVRIWGAATRQQLGDSVLGHEYSVWSVAISHDSKYVISGSGDSTVRVWDIEKRQLLSRLQGHAGWVYALAFSPDSTRIASGGDDYTVRIWDVASGKQVGDVLRGHTGDVRIVAFSPDGKRVASGSNDGTIRIWDVREVEKDGGTPVGHTSVVTSVACSSNGKYIISGSVDRTVRLWDAHTGQPVGDAMTGHDDAVSCVTFSSDSKQIASASSDGTVRLWDLETQLPVGDVLRGHNGPVLCVAFSSDGTWLVSGSADKTLRLWDLATGQQIGDAFCGHEDYVRSVSLSSDGLCIASGSDDCSIRIWEAETQLQRGPSLTGHKKYVMSVAFSPNNACVVSGSDDQSIRLWDTTTGTQIGGSLTGHVGTVRSVAFSPNGKYVVSGSYDDTVRVWDVQTGKQVGDALRGHGSKVRSVAFSSDGARIVSGSYDQTIRVWDFGSLQSLREVSNDAGADLTRTRVQAFIRENKNGWLDYDDNGTEQPILWIPHHLQHLHRVTSTYQIGFVPPAPHIRVTLTDSFRLDEWPTYTSKPAAEESPENVGPEA